MYSHIVYIHRPSDQRRLEGVRRLGARPDANIYIYIYTYIDT